MQVGTVKRGHKKGKGTISSASAESELGIGSTAQTVAMTSWLSGQSVSMTAAAK
jgi:hypothetical protein